MLQHSACVSAELRQKTAAVRLDELVLLVLSIAGIPSTGCRLSYYQKEPCGGSESFPRHLSLFGSVP